ncbi:hypothetical protein HDV05_004647 [Chytridiales sp. JEL 0842]|nr:hypothetical protein HDV05_004647 [Chytridiales sp. JEL 0842]
MLSAQDPLPQSFEHLPTTPMKNLKPPHFPPSASTTPPQSQPSMPSPTPPLHKLYSTALYSDAWLRILPSTQYHLPASADQTQFWIQNSNLLSLPSTPKTLRVISLTKIDGKHIMVPIHRVVLAMKSAKMNELFQKRGVSWWFEFGTAEEARELKARAGFGVETHEQEEEEEEEDEWWVDAEEDANTPPPPSPETHQKGNLPVYNIQVPDDGTSLLLLLEWIYTSDISLTLNSAWAVLALATTWEVKELVNVVENWVEGVLYSGAEPVFISSSSASFEGRVVVGSLRGHSYYPPSSSSEERRVKVFVRDEREWGSAVVGALKAGVGEAMLRRMVDLFVRDHLILEKRRRRGGENGEVREEEEDGVVVLEGGEYEELFGRAVEEASADSSMMFDDGLGDSMTANNNNQLSLRIKDPQILNSLFDTQAKGSISTRLSNRPSMDSLTSNTSFTALNNSTLFSTSSFASSSLIPADIQSGPCSLPFIAFLLLRSKVIQKRDDLLDPLTDPQIKTLLSLIDFENFKMDELEYLQKDSRLPRDVVVSALLGGVRGREKREGSLRRGVERVVEVVGRVVEREKSFLVGGGGSLRGSMRGLILEAGGTGSVREMGSIGRRSASVVASYLLRKLEEQANDEYSSKYNSLCGGTGGGGKVGSLRGSKGARIVVGSVRGSRRGVFTTASSLKSVFNDEGRGSLKANIEELPTMTVKEEDGAATLRASSRNVGGGGKAAPRRVRKALVMDLFEKGDVGEEAEEVKGEKGQEEPETESATLLQAPTTSALTLSISPSSSKASSVDATPNVTALLISPPKLDLPAPMLPSPQPSIPPVPPVRQNTKFVKALPKRPSLATVIDMQNTEPVDIPRQTLTQSSSNQPLPSPPTGPDLVSATSKGQEDATEDEDVYEDRDSLPGTNLPRLEDLPEPNPKRISNSFLEEMMNAGSDFEDEEDTSDETLSARTSPVKKEERPSGGGKYGSLRGSGVVVVENSNRPRSLITEGWRNLNSGEVAEENGRGDGLKGLEEEVYDFTRHMPYDHKKMMMHGHEMDGRDTSSTRLRSSTSSTHQSGGIDEQSTYYSDCETSFKKEPFDSSSKQLSTSAPSAASTSMMSFTSDKDSTYSKSGMTETSLDRLNSSRARQLAQEAVRGRSSRLRVRQSKRQSSRNRSNRESSVAPSNRRPSVVPSTGSLPQHKPLLAQQSDDENPDSSFMTITAAKVYTDRAAAIPLSRTSNSLSMPSLSERYHNDAASDSGSAPALPPRASSSLSSMSRRNSVYADPDEPEHEIHEPLSDHVDDEEDFNGTIEGLSTIASIEGLDDSRDFSIDFGDDVDLSLIEVKHSLGKAVGGAGAAAAATNATMFTKELQKAHDILASQPQNEGSASHKSLKGLNRKMPMKENLPPVTADDSNARHPRQSNPVRGPSINARAPRPDRKVSMIPSSSLAATKQMAMVGTWGPSSKLSKRMSMDGATLGLKKNTAKARVQSSTRASIDEVFAGILANSANTSIVSTTTVTSTTHATPTGTFSKNSFAGYLSIGKKGKGWSELKANLYGKEARPTSAILDGALNPIAPDTGVSTSSLNVAKWKGIKAYIEEKVDQAMLTKGNFADKVVIHALVITTCLCTVYLMIAQGITPRRRLFPVIDMPPCTFGLEEYGVLMVFVPLILGVLYPVVLWTLLDVRDPFYISRDIMLSVIMGLPATIIYFFTLIPGRPWITLPFMRDFLPICVATVSQVTSVVVPVFWSMSEAKAGATRHFRMNMESFKIVLDDEDLFENFKQFAARDLSVENPLFWHALKDLMKQTDRQMGTRKYKSYTSLFMGSHDARGHHDAEVGSITNKIGELVPDPAVTSTVNQSGQQHPPLSVQTAPKVDEKTSECSLPSPVREPPRRRGTTTSIMIPPVIVEMVGYENSENDLANISNDVTANPPLITTVIAEGFEKPVAEDNTDTLSPQSAESKISTTLSGSTAAQSCSSGASPDGDVISTTPSGTTHSSPTSNSTSPGTVNAVATTVPAHRANNSKRNTASSTGVSSFQFQEKDFKDKYQSDGSDAANEPENEMNLRVPENLRAKYKAFYNRFIRPGATNEVNLSSEVREKLKKRAKKGNWRRNDFDEAREEVLTTVVAQDLKGTFGSPVDLPSPNLVTVTYPDGFELNWQSYFPTSVIVTQKTIDAAPPSGYTLFSPSAYEVSMSSMSAPALQAGIEYIVDLNVIPRGRNSSDIFIGQYDKVSWSIVASEVDQGVVGYPLMNPNGSLIFTSEGITFKVSTVSTEKMAAPPTITPACLATTNTLTMWLMNCRTNTCICTRESWNNLQQYQADCANIIEAGGQGPLWQQINGEITRACRSLNIPVGPNGPILANGGASTGVNVTATTTAAAPTPSGKSSAPKNFAKQALIYGVLLVGVAVTAGGAY